MKTNLVNVPVKVAAETARKWKALCAAEGVTGKEMFLRELAYGKESGGMNVKCNKCGYVGSESEFPKGNDFLQQAYIAACPKCDNRQSPGDASMRMFGGQRPFEYVRTVVANTVSQQVEKQASEAS